MCWQWPENYGQSFTRSSYIRWRNSSKTGPLSGFACGGHSIFEDTRLLLSNLWYWNSNSNSFVIVKTLNHIMNLVTNKRESRERSKIWTKRKVSVSIYWCGGEVSNYQWGEFFVLDAGSHGCPSKDSSDRTKTGWVVPEYRLIWRNFEKSEIQKNKKNHRFGSVFSIWLNCSLCLLLVNLLKDHYNWDKNIIWL